MSGAPIDPSLPSQISLPLCIRPGGRGGLEELGSRVFSFPHPPAVVLCSGKVIPFLLTQGGLRGMKPSMSGKKRVTLGVACGAIPRQTVCPEALVPSFPFPFESVEACAPQTNQADD